MYGDWMEDMPIIVKENDDQFTKSQKEEIWEIAHPILSKIKNIFN